MPRFRWIVFLLFCAAPLSAQEAALIGVVRDSTTGLPLTDVLVTIPESDLSASSGPDGFFRLDGVKSGDHTIFVRKTGFEPWAMRMAVTVSDTRNISLGVVVLAPAFQATFFGTVVDSATGNPISGVEVGIVGQMQSSRTDDSGYFELPGVRSGTHEVTARHIGYGNWALEVALSIPQPMRVDFGEITMSQTAALALEDIVVEGDEFNGSMIMTEFFTRRRTEQGTFLTSEDIARLAPKNTSDLFRIMPGMNANRNGMISSGRGTSSMQAFEPCVAQYYIDGTKVTASTIDVVQPNAIAGIEVYRGSATTPQIFRSQSNASCGTIVIWTRDGRPNR